MLSKQIQSINLLDLECAVASKFNTCARIKTVWQNTMILTNGYFSPMATLCFVLGVGAKKSVQISRTEIDKILESWSLDYNISPVEASFLSSYSKFLKKIPFEIPQVNTLLPFNTKIQKVFQPQKIEVKKRQRKEKSNLEQIRLSLPEVLKNPNGTYNTFLEPLREVIN